MARLKAQNGSIVDVDDEFAERLVVEHRFVAAGSIKDEDAPYADRKLPALKAAVKARNEGRDEGDRIVPAGTKKEDMVAALEADDKAHTNGTGSSEPHAGD